MLNNKIEANIILSKCCKTKQLYGIRIEKKTDGIWHFTWAFKINDIKAKEEGYDSTRIPGNYVEDKTYKGCPYCGSDSWLLCSCGRLSCQENHKKYATISECQWCGSKGLFMPLPDEFEFKGGGEILGFGDYYMKNNKINAMVVLAKCSKTGRLYGNRVEKKNDGVWHFTWSFELNDLDIKNENYNETSINGKVILDDSYKGCPYCGTVGWFTCGVCNKLTCNDKNTGEKVSCKWCGHTAELGGDTDDFKLKGGGI